MSYYGDIRLGDTIDIKFCTVTTTGAPTQLAGTPVISAYPGNSTTQLTAGITLSVDFDGVTGLNNVRVVASSGNGYAAATNYALIITAGTVGGTSVVGYEIGSFSIENRSALMPTTAGRTLDVSAGGEAGLDWANIGSPTTAQNLSATNIDVDQVVASVSGAVGSVTGNVGGNVTGSIGSLAPQAKADVNAEVDTALADVRLDELLAADSDIDGAAPPTVGSVFHELMTKTTGSFTFDQTTDSLEAIRDRGDAAWITATGFSTLDAAGVRSAVGLAAANLDTQLSTIDDFLDTEIAAIITTLGTPAGASLAADIAAIEAQTDDIGAAGAGLTAIPWNAAWDTEVQSEVDDALVARNLDKLILASGTADSGSTTTMVDAARTEGDADYWKGRLILFTSGNIAGQCAIVTDFVVATDTFTFAPPVTQAVSTQNYVILPGISVWDDTLAEHLISGSTGAALNAAGSAGDPWNTALPGAYGAGSAGFIIGTNVNATVSSRATQTSVDTIDTNVDSILADTGTDGVVVAAGSKTGYTLSAAGIQAIWDALTSALTTVGSIGKLLVDNINATISSRASQTSVDTVDDFLDTEIATLITNTSNIEADTQDIQTRLPAALVGGRIDANAGAISGDATAADNAEAFFDGTGYAGTNNTIPTVTTLTNLPAITPNWLTAAGLAADAVAEIQAGLSTLTAAQVNAEMVDVLTVDVIADSISTDGNRPTIAQAALMILRFLTEKSVSGTTVTVHKEDGSTSSFTLTLNDATSPSSITRAS